MLEVNPWPELIGAYLRGEALEATARFALARAWALEHIRGAPFENAAARLVHAPAGLYAELKAPPAGYLALLGPVVGEYLAAAEARRLFWEALSLAERRGWALWVVDGGLGTVFWGRRKGVLSEAPAFFAFEAGRQGLLALALGDEYLVFRYRPGRPVLGGAAA